MTDYMDLALKYGGFTSLDKVYLKNTLSDLSDSQKLAFITPPPSVINAYFAEIYQKQSQVFPQYKVYLEGSKIKMAKVDFDEEVLEELTPEGQLLSRVSKLKGNVIKLASFNQDELVELLAQYKGQVIYYGFAQRECLAYIVQK